MGRLMNLTDHYDLGQPVSEVIFSLDDDFVWASWSCAAPRVRLGRYEDVIAMMRDFIAQSELGERLANGKTSISNARGDLLAL
jgi:hypothetical protein